MIPAHLREAFLADSRRAHNATRRETLLTIWTARICADERLPLSGTHANRIRAELRTAAGWDERNQT
jgi:hypothetical protein